eukprot:174300-Rhodomonas_salina.1
MRAPNARTVFHLFIVALSIAALEVAALAASKPDLLTHIADCNGGDTQACSQVEQADTSAIQDMSELFMDMSEVTALDLSGWDTSNVTTMRSMFQGASSFNGTLLGWDTSAVKD